MEVKDYSDIKQISEAQKALANERDITVSISECPKCQNPHEDLKFERLKHPVKDGSGMTYTHVGLCESTQLQLRLAFQSPAVVAGRERADRLKQVGQQLRIDDMAEDDIQKVLDALNAEHAA